MKKHFDELTTIKTAGMRFDEIATLVNAFEECKDKIPNSEALIKLAGEIAFKSSCLMYDHVDSFDSLPTVGFEVMDHIKKFIRDNIDRFSWYGNEVSNALGRIQSGEVIFRRYAFDYVLSLGNYDNLATLRYLRDRNLIKCRDRCFTRSRLINGKKEDCIILLIDTRELKK